MHRADAPRRTDTDLMKQIGYQPWPIHIKHSYFDNVIKSFSVSSISYVRSISFRAAISNVTLPSIKKKKVYTVRYTDFKFGEKRALLTYLQKPWVLASGEKGWIVASLLIKGQYCPDAHHISLLYIIQSDSFQLQVFLMLFGSLHEYLWCFGGDTPATFQTPHKDNLFKDKRKCSQWVLAGHRQVNTVSTHTNTPPTSCLCQHLRQTLLDSFCLT